MAQAQDYFVSALVVGTGATAVMDLWALIRQRLFGIAPADYGLVGRWLGHMLRGRFRHESITASAPVRGERAIGWIAHYGVGVAFASALLAIWGIKWVDHPRIVPALIVGIGSVAAPFLLMQPGMGAGIAASRTANPRASRLRSFATHAVFGVGLYAAGWALNLFKG